MINDILSLLKNLPEWNRLLKLPAEVEALRERVAMLERSAAGIPAQRDECPKCHGLAFRLLREELAAPPFDQLGVRQQVFHCPSCGFESVKRITSR